jgi:hypothetical protein
MTEPRMKQFFTDCMCGNCATSSTLMFSNFTFKYWSTECSVPRIDRSAKSNVRAHAA